MLRFEFPRVVTTTMAVPFVLKNVIVTPFRNARFMTLLGAGTKARSFGTE